MVIDNVIVIDHDFFNVIHEHQKKDPLRVLISYSQFTPLVCQLSLMYGIAPAFETEKPMPLLA